MIEHALKDTHLECFLGRHVRFNDQKKHKTTPWMTNGILRSINTRNKDKKYIK